MNSDVGAAAGVLETVESPVRGVAAGAAGERDCAGGLLHWCVARSVTLAVAMIRTAARASGAPYHRWLSQRVASGRLGAISCGIVWMRASIPAQRSRGGW